MESPVLRGDAYIGAWCACSVNITGVAIMVGGTQILGIGDYGVKLRSVIISCIHSPFNTASIFNPSTKKPESSESQRAKVGHAQ